MSNNEAMGILINFQYCTGCHTCELACKAEHDLPQGQWGIKILEDGPRQLPDGKKWEYNYLPYLTSLCNLCAERTAEGRLPKCVHHCQAGIMEYGTLEELAKASEGKPGTAILTPVA